MARCAAAGGFARCLCTLVGSLATIPASNTQTWILGAVIAKGTTEYHLTPLEIRMKDHANLIWFLVALIVCLSVLAIAGAAGSARAAAPETTKGTTRFHDVALSAGD